jgi:hypothetical protein
VAFHISFQRLSLHLTVCCWKIQQFPVFRSCSQRLLLLFRWGIPTVLYRIINYIGKIWSNKTCLNKLYKLFDYILPIYFMIILLFIACCWDIRNFPVHLLRDFSFFWLSFPVYWFIPCFCLQ